MTLTQQETVAVELGQKTVDVPAGGLYDRYRMDTDLDAVAQDPRVPGMDFFRSLPKTRVDSPIGPTWTPNFYYAASTARLVMLAPTRRLRDRLPRALSPLEVGPGLGIFSIMVFRYDVADIDFYTEAATGIAVKPIRHGGLGAVDLAAALKNDRLHSYVLSLPVNTQIAQVRGRDGYGFPKWVTPIDVGITAARVSSRVANDTGGIDLELSAPTPPQTQRRPLERVSFLTSYTQIDGNWHSTLNQTHALASGRALPPRGARLRLGQGRLSEDIRSVAPKRILALDVTTSAQMALHMPVPISAGPLDATGREARS
ncbi:acetoacetate decarboxylase family protein [Brevibacterium album]|uniref:acetoacetate decarboxylase family protein n=1 Tax=Brevibacterium album TaxID=417948 RepID=UPI00042884D1|nr:acetoacetate decarboxylase family protein [Brevibacterium album]